MAIRRSFGDASPTHDRRKATRGTTNTVGSSVVAANRIRNNGSNAGFQHRQQGFHRLVGCERECSRNRTERLDAHAQLLRLWGVWGKALVDTFCQESFQFLCVVRGNFQIVHGGTRPRNASFDFVLALSFVHGISVVGLATREANRSKDAGRSLQEAFSWLERIHTEVFGSTNQILCQYIPQTVGKVIGNRRGGSRVTRCEGPLSPPPCCVE
mmetsp:Transcript_11186/g.23611  ORF Transcript_11186/g.23611 Transcript_11186/m.23611 type:complete len:212 (+) Transcript_11186:650-1285(+)